MTPTATATAPESMPVLSRGKHRNPRRGACFMEMASFLGGERWSDHPACTHPLLAQMARLVNDGVSDEFRARLVPLIPSVIGLTGDDPHLDVVVALRAAAAAVPIAAGPRQRVLATALLSCERVLAGLDGGDPDSLSGSTRHALDQVPGAETWARTFSDGHPVSHRTFREKTAPRIVQIAVESIALACAPDVEQRLIDLLATTIADCEALVTTSAVPMRRAATERAWCPQGARSAALDKT
ncbi:MAG: hypothetical protein H7270_03925 [Dermatophilaceae bacterium]|nr:hypothetical protein [Dermatophilaceae bacterium]